MKLVLEIPTNKTDELRAIHDVAAATEDPRIKFALALNGESFSSSTHDARMRNLYQHCVMPKVKPVSMMELRFLASTVADGFDPDVRMMADSDFVFKPGWEAYVIECAQFIMDFERSVHHRAYLGMAGVFGSAAHGKKIAPAARPLFELGRGIMYTDENVWGDTPFLPGGMEEYLFTAILFHSGAMPFKRFLAPIRHDGASKKVTYDTGDVIHERSITDANNQRAIQELFDEPSWVLPSEYGVGDMNPKRAMRALALRKKELGI